MFLPSCGPEAYGAHRAYGLYEHGEGLCHDAGHVVHWWHSGVGPGSVLSNKQKTNGTCSDLSSAVSSQSHMIVGQISLRADFG